MMIQMAAYDDGLFFSLQEPNFESYRIQSQLEGEDDFSFAGRVVDAVNAVLDKHSQSECSNT